ncbi:MAG: DUF4102 domain-containing protein [Chitinophagaceae bacterium]|nr:MAG: DUF4102 domain-containing protein [Chitinophagaceae bacterium]
MGELTAFEVKSALTPGRYQDGDGLFLLVKSKTSRSWMLRIQVDGKRRDFGLGSAADVSLADARKKAEDTRRLYIAGIDPVEAREAARLVRDTIPTFEEAAEAVHAEREGSWRSEKHAAQWLASLKAYAFPLIGKRRVDQIDGPPIRDVLMRIWQSKPETARRLRQRIGVILDWAHAKGYRPAEAPMRSVSKGLPRQTERPSHFAALSYDKCPVLMSKLAENDTVGRLALRFTILTAARSGEVRGATWDEIDSEEKIWNVPAERMKARREHRVPLSSQALDVLEKVRAIRAGSDAELVFPGRSSGVMSDMTLTKALRDAGYDNSTVHGFRSSFRDWAGETTGAASDIIEAALAHVISNKTKAAYARSDYLELRRELMASWGDFLRPDENATRRRTS